MTHPGAVRSGEIVRFLKHLRRHIRGPVIVLWDGLLAHRSRETLDYVRSQSAWLTVHRLPAYAPELNPVEGLWAWLKGTTNANFCPTGLTPIRQQLRRGSGRLRGHPDVLRGFLHKAHLSI